MNQIPSIIYRTIAEVTEWLQPLGYEQSNYKSDSTSMLVTHRDMYNKPYPTIRVRFSLDMKERYSHVTLELPANVMQAMKERDKMIAEGMEIHEAMVKLTEQGLQSNQIVMIADVEFYSDQIQSVIDRMMFYADVFDTYGQINP